MIISSGRGLNRRVTNSQEIIPAEMKDPHAELDYTVNWADLLNPDGASPPADAIVSSVWEVAPFTELAQAIDEVETLLHLEDTTGFPPSAMFDVTCEGERMSVERISGDRTQYTVARGVNGTRGVAHQSHAILHKTASLRVTSQSLSPVMNPLVATAFVKGGIAGREYTITNRIVSQGGRINDQSIRISVKRT
jgi:hypothetical protein